MAMEFIGNGAHGNVYSFPYGDGFAAAKFLPASSTYDFARHRTEANLLRSLSHDNVVRFLDYTETVEGSILVTDVHKLSLRTFIETFHANDLISTVFTIDVMRGIHFVHGKCMVHRDIKMDNVLVAKTQSQPGWKAVLIDFGLAHSFSTPMEDCLDNAVGTVSYASPEVLSVLYGPSQMFDAFQSDLWSLSILAFEITHKQKPFAAATLRDEKYALFCKGCELGLDVVSSLSLVLNRVIVFHPTLLCLVNTCLQPDARRRLKRISHLFETIP